MNRKNYIILESSVNKLMLKYLLDKKPNFPLELIEKEVVYNSGINKENSYVQTYYDAPDGRTIFTKFSDENPYENVKWSVSDRLEFLFEMFGDDLFADFVMNLFGLNLRDKGDKQYNWVFR